MWTKAQQMLRKASVFLGKASREVRIPSLRPPRAFPATVPSRGALAMDTSHRGVFADVSATKPATFSPRLFPLVRPRPSSSPLPSVIGGGGG